MGAHVGADRQSAILGLRDHFCAESSAEAAKVSAHPDFLWSQADGRRQAQYLCMLYCKELVLENFPGADPASLLDRMVQLTSRLAR